jgi:hypothetical protein
LDAIRLTGRVSAWWEQLKMAQERSEKGENYKLGENEETKKEISTI